MISRIRQHLFLFFPALIFIIFANLFLNGERIHLNNISSVLSVFVLCFLLINKETFIFNKNTIIILLFSLIFFFSSVFAENMIISLKRFLIVFVPFLIIFQTFQNHKNPEFIYRAEKYLLCLIIILCIYSLIVFALDLLYATSLSKELSMKINKIVLETLNYSDNNFIKVDVQFNKILQKVIIILNQYQFSDQIILNYEVSIKEIFEQLKTQNLSIYAHLTNTFQFSQLILKESIIEPWEVSNNLLGIGQVYTSRYDLNFDFKWLRPSSLMSNTIGFANILIIGICLVITNKYYNQFLNSFIIFFLYIFLIWTLARFNILIALFLIPLLILTINRKKPLLYLFIVKFFIIFIFIIFMSTDLKGLLLNINDLFYYKASDLNNPDFYEKGEVLNNYEKQKVVLGNIHDRFDLIRLVLLDLKKFLITGVGFGTSFENFLVNKFNTLELHKHLTTVAIPSVPITLLAETGLIGFLAYISILPVLIQNTDFSHPKQKSILFILIVIYASQYFDISLFRFHPLTFLFAFYLGIILNKNLKSHG